jgi:hypothetical protein
VIGQRKQIHAPAPQNCVDFLRVAVTFAAEIPDKRGRTGSREVGVNMQVAFHETNSSSGLLPDCDRQAKVLKTLLLNSYGIVHSHLTGL